MASAKDVLFKHFKESPGKKIFILKYNGDKDKEVYSKVLSVLKERGYVDYTVNFSNIQVFLTTAGTHRVLKHDGWDTSDDK